MIVIDTSVLVAILGDEPGARRYTELIAEDAEPRISAATFAEAGIVLTSRYGTAGLHYLQLFLAKAGVEIVPLDAGQAEIAVRAYQDFGKANHPAGLNYGDCFSYALARTSDSPLLFKGTDFSQTDITAATEEC